MTRITTVIVTVILKLIRILNFGKVVGAAVVSKKKMSKKKKKRRPRELSVTSMHTREKAVNVASLNSKL